MKCTCLKPKVIHITEVRGGHFEILDLCEGCASKYLKGEEISVNLDEKDKPPPPPPPPKEDPAALKKEFLDKTLKVLQNILGKPVQLEKVPDLPPCPACGITFTEIYKSGKVGCLHCWDHFEQELIPILKRVQDGFQHKGKVPKRYQKKEPPRKVEQVRLDALISAAELMLKDSVQREDYENAAIVRDYLNESKGIDAELEVLKGALETAVIQGDPADEIRLKMDQMLDRVRLISNELSSLLSNFPKPHSASEDQ